MFHPPVRPPLVFCNAPPSLVFFNSLNDASSEVQSYRVCLIPLRTSFITLDLDDHYGIRFGVIATYYLAYD